MGTRSTEPGVRFTPPDLALQLARQLLNGAGVETPPGVFDPACGTGELLIAAWRTGRSLGLTPERVFGFELDPERAEEARRRIAAEIGPRAAENILVADALTTTRPWPRGTHVIANPPWISFSGPHAPQGAEFDRYRELFQGLDGWPSLHGAFLERIAAHIAREHTRAAVLVPAPLVAAEAYGPVRRRITTEARLLSAPTRLNEGIFPGVTESAVIVELGSGASASDGSDAAWVESANDDDALVAELDRFPRLPENSYGDIGVHTGNSAEALLIVGGKEIDLPGIREGRDLIPYRVRAPRLHLDTAVETSLEQRFRYGALERYRDVPVLIRQTADRPIAALHTDPTYFRNTLLACSPPAELDPAFVVAVLNAPVAAAWHKLRFREGSQKTFPQVKILHLRSLPFPFLTRASAPELHDRIAKLSNELARDDRTPATAEDRAEVEDLVCEAYGLPAESLRRLRRVAAERAAL